MLSSEQVRTVCPPGSCHRAHVVNLQVLKSRLLESLLLRYVRYPDTTIEVSTTDNFSLLAPKGGYNKEPNIRSSYGQPYIKRYYLDSLYNTVTYL